MVVPAKRRSVPTTAVLLWSAGTCLLALSPLVYFASGASDGATETGRIALAAVPALVAWPLLVLALALAYRRQRQATKPVLWPAAHRASLLMLLAGAVLVLARQLGSAVAIHGDATWTFFWTGSVVLWVALSGRTLARPHERRG
jgi:hypothetical protein